MNFSFLLFRKLVPKNDYRICSWTIRSGSLLWVRFGVVFRGYTVGEVDGETLSAASVVYTDRHGLGHPAKPRRVMYSFKSTAGILTIPAGCFPWLRPSPGTVVPPTSRKCDRGGLALAAESAVTPGAIGAEPPQIHTQVTSKTRKKLVSSLDFLDINRESNRKT